MAEKFRIKIEISARADGDRYVRVHGKTVDEDLQGCFWITQPKAHIGIAGGSFSHSETVELPIGRHYVVYGVSAWVGHWDAIIKGNGITIDEGEVYLRSCAEPHYLKARFIVVPFPPYVIPEKPPGPPFESSLATANNILVYAATPILPLLKVR